MTCSRCRKPYPEKQARCPHCGESNPAVSGVFQTSTVLISAGGSELVYRSVDEVPAALRTKLLRSTNGANSASILIADQKGRKELAKAMRKLPGPAQRRLRSSILGTAEAAAAAWLTPARKRTILVALVLLVLLVITAVFGHRWETSFR